MIRLKSASSPEAEGRVGEVRRTVEVWQVQAAPDVVHGRQRHVGALRESPAQGSLASAVTQSHQTIILVQTEEDEELVSHSALLKSFPLQ